MKDSTLLRAALADFYKAESNPDLKINLSALYHKHEDKILVCVAGAYRHYTLNGVEDVGLESRIDSLRRLIQVQYAREPGRWWRRANQLLFDLEASGR